ncbi:hypothetical protein P8452_05990 [Trifolium repens]|nr:hypothetical protein P8452_05990 [Trifolium repens]
MVSLRRRKLLGLCSENNSCENLAHYENSGQNANPTGKQSEAALVNLKKALDEKEAALSEMDAALRDALAREEKVKQDYPEILKKITAFEMAMAAEEQKPY